MSRKQKPCERKPFFGSISSGTMRAEDLIPAFLRELEYYAPARATELRKTLDGCYDDCDEEADNILDQLFDALGSVACRVPYMTFGAHEGDSADYGFWLAHDSLQDDMRYGVVLRWCDDSRNPTREELAQGGYGGYSYYLRENDHGNITLYNRAHRVVWSLV